MSQLETKEFKRAEEHDTIYSPISCIATLIVVDQCL